jgi:hypothetical protein
MVPQPVNQTELAKTPHFTQVQDLRMCISFRFAAIKQGIAAHATTPFDLNHPGYRQKLI